MSVCRVALFSNQRLLGESIQHLLSSDQAVDLLGVWLLDENMFSRLEQSRPSVVVIVDEGASVQSIDLINGNETETLESHESIDMIIASILERFDNLPVVRIALDNSLARVYRTQTIPARSDLLLRTILEVTE